MINTLNLVGQIFVILQVSKNPETTINLWPLERPNNSNKENRYFSTAKKQYASPAPYDRRKDSVMENVVYPTLKPRTWSSLRSLSAKRNEEVTEVEKKVTQWYLPRKSQVVYEENPRFSTERKSVYQSATRRQVQHMYHLSNVIGKTFEKSFGW